MHLIRRSPTPAFRRLVYHLVPPWYPAITSQLINKYHSYRSGHTNRRNTTEAVTTQKKTRTFQFQIMKITIEHSMYITSQMIKQYEAVRLYIQKTKRKRGNI